MTERVKEYLKRYPTPEYLVYEDQQPDRERMDFFMSLTDEEQIYILRHEGVPEQAIASCFDI